MRFDKETFLLILSFNDYRDLHIVSKINLPLDKEKSKHVEEKKVNSCPDNNMFQ